MGEEICISYERPKREFMPLVEPVGGAYVMLDCDCGARFCMGAIARRVLTNRPTDYDPFFLDPHPTVKDMLRIDLAFLRKANDRYAERKPAEKDIKSMCQYIKNGAEVKVDAEMIANCSRCMSVDSCCVSMGVKNA